MRYLDIYKEDVANGPKVRTTLYIQGCPHHCSGCFNPETWSYSANDNSKEFTDDVKNEIIKLASRPYIDGISLLGGDPLARTDDDLYELLSDYKSKNPNKTVWCWSGFIIEDILNESDNIKPYINYIKKILPFIDVLVDGPFIKKLKSDLRWRGSSNQRFINIKQTLNKKEIVLEDISKYR